MQEHLQQFGKTTPNLSVHEKKKVHTRREMQTTATYHGGQRYVDDRY